MTRTWDKKTKQKTTDSPSEIEKFTIFIHLSLLTTTSTVLTLSVCRMPVTYELRAKWPYSPWVLVAQWIERPPNVWEVMHSILVRDSDFFLCPRLMSCWPIHLSHFITKLKVHHLYSLITIIDYVQVEYAQALGFHSNVSSTGSLLLDYEQSLFFSWSIEQNAREYTRAWLKARAAALVSRVSRLRRSTLSHARG